MTQTTFHHFGLVTHHDDPHALHAPRGPGHCTLVGIGPGGPGLLTAHTLKTIQTATLLLVDAQVTEAVVALATPAARVVRLGQRPAHPATTQAFLEKLIIMAVREGNSVVHIRVEDPRTTDCAGEEITHLQAAGINVRLEEMSLGFPSLKLSQNS